MGLPSDPEGPERRLSEKTATTGGLDAPYRAVFGDVSKIIDAARDSAARSVNAAMTAAYWLTGRRIVEFEQSGGERAEYGAALVERLAEDLTAQFGRGFSLQNIYNMRLLYLSYPIDRRFSRHCLENRLYPHDSRFSRRRLENSIPHPSSWASTTFSQPSHFPGPHTCACSRSGTRAPASSTRPRR